MGKIILHENITPEGYCDHRAFVADEELMQSINDLLGTADKAIFGRVTLSVITNVRARSSKVFATVRGGLRGCSTEMII